jgi:hypothetical protein
MQIEIGLFIFTVLVILILIISNKFYQQKLINKYLIREFELLRHIKIYESLIRKRYLRLNTYDFQLYNLDEALLDD